jgi:hypothetical protein
MNKGHTSLGPTRTTSPFVVDDISSHATIEEQSGHLTITCVQLDEFMAEGSIRDTFDVRLPVYRYPGHWWTRELCQRVEVHIVDDSVHGIRDDGCKSCR